MGLTTAEITVDGWDLDVIIRDCDERLLEIEESYIHCMITYGRDVGENLSLWDWYWDLASKCHDANRRIEKEIDER